MRGYINQELRMVHLWCWTYISKWLFSNTKVVCTHKTSGLIINWLILCVAFFLLHMLRLFFRTTYYNIYLHYSTIYTDYLSPYCRVYVWWFYGLWYCMLQTSLQTLFLYICYRTEGVKSVKNIPRYLILLYHHNIGFV